MIIRQDGQQPAEVWLRIFSWANVWGSPQLQRASVVGHVTHVNPIDRAALQLTWPQEVRRDPMIGDFVNSQRSLAF